MRTPDPGLTAPLTYPFFRVESSWFVGARRVVVAGEVDLETSTQLADAVLGAAQVSPTVELDLGRVTFMDSRGLATLLELAEQLSGAFRVTSTSQPVRRVLEITGTAGRFGVDA